jgi:hypothetical protein
MVVVLDYFLLIRTEMPTADNSYVTRTKLIQSRAQAAFHSSNPTVRDMQGAQFQESILLSRKMGQLPNTFQPSGILLPACCGCEAPSGDITISATDGYDGTNFYYDLTWNTITNVDTYALTTIYEGVVYTNVTNTSARATLTQYNGDQIIFVVTASNSCGSTTATTSVNFPCFLAGSLVSLADGTVIPIENVKVGDIVIGAFVEYNTVLALHRPLLGLGKMVKINDDHITSAHHPHISLNKSFYSADPVHIYTNTYGKEHEVLNAEGEFEMRMLYGLVSGRVKQLITGILLKTIEGSREVKNIEYLDYPSDTQLYNLVVGGSHTYHVEGYAVTGWPREDDFDYDNWVPK